MSLGSKHWLYKGLCSRLHTHGVAETERFCMATYPASGWPRPFWPLRPVSPISKQGSRLCKGKISNSRRFRSWLGFQFAWDWEPIKYILATHSGFSRRSWAKTREVGNCLWSAFESDYAPGSLGPVMMSWDWKLYIESLAKYELNYNDRW